MARLVNNERSEAIELIKLMDRIAKRNTWQIKSVGGESTLNTGSQRMFPDVFVYGDLDRTQILQGWEVKMPDVPITDANFIHDAQRKAEVLRVNSCFTWNFTFGVLYVKDRDIWTRTREWDGTRHIRTRADVMTYKANWEALVSEILGELNTFFSSGELHPARIGDIVTDTIFAEILNRNKGLVAEHLQAAGVRNTTIAAHISQWWRGVEMEYRFDQNNQYAAYAQTVLLNWINKFTFAHMIKRNHNPATIVEHIDEGVTPADALKKFEGISARCDFFNIFEAIPYGDVLPVATWTDLTDYSAFLCENGLANIPQTALQSVLEKSVNQFKRNVAGVFTTPQKLAKILVNAGVTDLTAPAIDPCCGTGTIVKEILDAKNVVGVDRAYSTTYASDKYSFPLQVSNIAMTRANAINLPSLLFRANAFSLHENQVVPIIDPRNGERREIHLPKWGSLVSNLPFVAFDQEGREESDHIHATLDRVRADIGVDLSGRADLYQALLLHLHSQLADNASVAVITSNSWLGTLAGQEFFRALNYYYSIESIVTSGNGKWFDNADVITLMLFLKKKPMLQAPSATHAINFGLIHKALPDLTDDDSQQIINSIRLKRAVAPALLSFKTYSLAKINELLDMNIVLNCFFYDVNWLEHIRCILCPVTDLFDVFRGMKTGQDEIWYLNRLTDVDPAFVGRVFKSARSAEYLIAQPDTYSFVCDKTLEELRFFGCYRTLEWINRFRGHINQSVPHKETFWMNLADGSFSGSDRIRLFTGMNPERRIFYGLLKEPAQINQRAIGFKPKSKDVNLELCHALLNSVIGVFYTEATGFPKGLGALDNRADNTKKIYMLDPRRLSPENAARILKAFKPLLTRKISTTADEYTRTDRLAFEHVVADCFGYAEQFECIKHSLLEMQKVRLSVR